MPKIGIMLIPEDETLIAFRESLKLEKIDYIPPHLTLCIFEIFERDKEDIKKLALELSKNFLPVTLESKGVEQSSYGTLRLVIKINKKIQEFHEMLLNSLVKFRDNSAPSKSKQFYAEFSPEEQKLIDIYGRPNVMTKFEPHITLGKANKKVDEKFDRKITVRKITTYYDSGEGWSEI